VVHPVCCTRRNCGHRGRPRRSPPCAAVECLPAQVPSANGPLVSMHSSHAPARPRAPPASPESAETRRPHGRGPNCLVPFLYRDLSARQGPGCNILYLSRGSGAKCNSNCKQILLKLVKSLENRRKFRKLQTQFS
jgi:hypothetical protein